MSQKQSKRVCTFLMYLNTHFDPVILTTTNIENASFELENYYNFCQSPETVENKLKNTIFELEIKTVRNEQKHTLFALDINVWNI